ncbi:MAG TPA: ABC transporter substrate-binding protein [Acidimicrobiales bacterium]|nr:ABC transporter substrate-binding protein [Acidimicrobiales bacterium]
MTIGAVASSLSMGLIAPAVSGASAPSGTISFAEGAGASPNYIFPYMGCAYFSVSTINQFQELMYRPLYWFGIKNSAAYVPSLSPGNSPKFSNGNKTITITMKGWKFADGQTVNAQSVMFFLNMYKADPSSYCGYNGGYGIPDQVKSASGKGNTVKINFTTSVNPGWILYNYLSEITPFPTSWDRTSATTKSHCSTGVYGAASTNVACKNVEHYLDAMSGKTNTYTNSMWQGGVDGPWRLTSFDNLGNATFQPNNKYSGPQKAQVRYVKLVAYTSTQAEENDLQAGKLTMGYVDTGVLTAPAPAPFKVGPNWGQLAQRYNGTNGAGWAFNYMPFNFSSNNPNSAAVSQLYIRQALQTAVDQQGILTNIFKGYGWTGYSPLPPNTPSSVSGPVANPYPFNLTAAKALLTSHGWAMQGGVMTCTNPGTGASQCGAGIAQGHQLTFNLIYISGYPAYDQVVAALASDWAQIGVKLSHTTDTFNNLIGKCSGGAGFDLCWWGAGWSYAPDYYPSGETLFSPTGGFNVGGYNNPTMTGLIKQTTFGTAKLTAYATLAAKDLPVLYMPTGGSMGEISKALKSKIGFQPNPLQNLMPEYYHF